MYIPRNCDQHLSRTLSGFSEPGRLPSELDATRLPLFPGVLCVLHCQHFQRVSPLFVLRHSGTRSDLKNSASLRDAFRTQHQSMRVVSRVCFRHFRTIQLVTMGWMRSSYAPVLEWSDFYSMESAPWTGEFINTPGKTNKFFDHKNAVNGTKTLNQFIFLNRFHRPHPTRFYGPSTRILSYAWCEALRPLCRIWARKIASGHAARRHQFHKRRGRPYAPKQI